MNLANTICCLVGLLFLNSLYAQTSINGTVTLQGEPLPFANVFIENISIGTTTDNDGKYTLENIPDGNFKIKVSFTGLAALTQKFVAEGKKLEINFNFEETSSLDEIVITGTMKPVTRSSTPVPVEVYKPSFFKKNPTPNIFDALQNVNGVRPQLNCNVCNTGDIHINGLEGPYTLVLIDGMPIVSGLSTVYGLSGIPNALLERVEIVKGPASSLYGSEAVGGLINIITQKPNSAPKF